MMLVLARRAILSALLLCAVPALSHAQTTNPTITPTLNVPANGGSTPRSHPPAGGIESATPIVTYKIPDADQEDDQRKTTSLQQTVSMAFPFFSFIGQRLGVQFGSFQSVGASKYDAGWGILGLTYRLQPPNKRTLLQPDLYMDLGGTRGSLQTTTVGADLRQARSFWGIGMSARSVAYMLNGSASAYLGAGGGMYRLNTYDRFERYGSGSDPLSSYSRQSSTDFRPGYKLFAGVTHKSGLFLESAWHDAGKARGLAYRGIALSLGLRR